MSDDEVPVELLLDGASGDQDPGTDWDDDADDRDAEMLGVSVVNWRELTDDDAPQTWATLAGWVDWFINRYEIQETKIPACWWQHGPLVEELSALHTAWLVSFDETDSGYGPIGWHERLTVALQRIGGWYHGQCSAFHIARDRTRRADPQNQDEWKAWIRTSHAPSAPPATP